MEPERLHDEGPRSGRHLSGRAQRQGIRTSSSPRIGPKHGTHMHLGHSWHVCPAGGTRGRGAVVAVPAGREAAQGEPVVGEAHIMQVLPASAMAYVWYAHLPLTPQDAR